MCALPSSCDPDGMSRNSGGRGGNDPVIEVQNLHKAYAETVAVDDISFAVQEGEIFGILGPNGAGKTTTVECIEGLRRPDGGRISVLGLDPQRDRAELTQRLGVQLQDSQLPGRLRVAEALDLYSSFYRNPADWRGLMDVLGLATSATPGSASCPAARSSGCRSRWRCSAAPRSRCSTSSPPGWTRRPAATPGS